MRQARVPAAIVECWNDAGHRSRILRAHAQGATEGCLAYGAGLARTAIHSHFTDQLGREVARGVVGPVVLVAKRHAIKGDVVQRVIKAADGQVLGFTQTRAVGLNVRYARGDVSNRRKVRRRHHVVGDIRQTNYRARLKRINLYRCRHICVERNGLGHHFHFFKALTGLRALNG